MSVSYVEDDGVKPLIFHKMPFVLVKYNVREFNFLYCVGVLIERIHFRRKYIPVAQCSIQCDQHFTNLPCKNTTHVDNSSYFVKYYGF